MAIEREEEQEFLETLAWAITQWQYVEMELYRVFLGCIKPRNQAVVSAAFHAVINFNTRLAMTDAAAHIALHNLPELDEWKKLAKQAPQSARSFYGSP